MLYYNEDIINENLLDDMKEKFKNISDLKSQWKKVSDDFVKHKWIYRYTDDKQKEILEKHYAVLTNPDTSYNDYKKSFKYICKFIGIPHHMVIIENLVFKKDDVDKHQWEISVKYSKGLLKVKIPEGIRLIHISPVKGIKELIPSFRSKVAGKYMYPSKRIFFTVAKDIKPNQAGLEKQATYRYTPKSDIQYAYIDPTYADFSSGSVYVETDSDIPVETMEKRFDKINNIRRKFL